MARHKQSERNDLMSETRRLLLEAAIEEFAHEGYVGGNINRISKAAGFAKGTIYNYFESKRALMLALIEEIAEAHHEFMSERVLEEDDPARRLEAFYSAGFDWVEDNLARGQVMVNNLYGPHSDFKQVMFEAYQPMFGLVAVEIIVKGIEQGIFRQVDPVETSGLLMLIYLGIASQVNEQGRPWIAPQPVTDFVLHALRKAQSK